ncbi:MAG: alpha/beta hydrolase [Deltaproteobacteria bacterium]|nr:alpha/beta hydrolase [Deltaproteobacteria bacterium]
MSARWRAVAVVFHGNRVRRMTDFSDLHAIPVLLLQGFGSTRLSLSILEKRLRTDGYHVFSLRLGGWFGTLNTRAMDTIAQHVLGKIAGLRERFHLPRIHIIGHSKGGLIARYLVSCLGGDAHVATVITLGTPHQGIPPAHLRRVTPFGIFMKSIRQMNPRSPFFQRLAAHAIPPTVRCVSIASAADTVVPPQLAQLPTPAGAEHCSNVEVAGLTHTDFLLKATAYHIIRRYLPVDNST